VDKVEGVVSAVPGIEKAVGEFLAGLIAEVQGTLTSLARAHTQNVCTHFTEDGNREEAVGGIVTGVIAKVPRESVSSAHAQD